MSLARRRHPWRFLRGLKGTRKRILSQKYLSNASRNQNSLNVHLWKEAAKVLAATLDSAMGGGSDTASMEKPFIFVVKW
jgi:hypothetical protein